MLAEPAINIKYYTDMPGVAKKRKYILYLLQHDYPLPLKGIFPQHNALCFNL